MNPALPEYMNISLCSISIKLFGLAETISTMNMGLIWCTQTKEKVAVKWA